MRVRNSETLSRSQWTFLIFCGAGLCISLGAWFVNLDVACRYFFSAGIFPAADRLPGYRQLSALAVDLSTITPALFVSLFGLPLYASRYREMPFPRNFFSRCTYAGLAGTLIGIMMVFWNGGASGTPLEQAELLFAQLSAGLPTAIVSTLAGLVVGCAAIYLTKWYCIVFKVSAPQSESLKTFSRTVQLATGSFHSLMDEMGRFQQGCIESVNVIQRFVARTSALNKSLGAVGSSMDAIHRRIASALSGLAALLKQMERSSESSLKSTAAITSLVGELQLMRKRLEATEAENQSLRTQQTAQMAAVIKHLGELPDAIATAIASGIKPIETAVAAGQRQFCNRIAHAFSADLNDSSPNVKEPNDVSRNGIGNGFSRH